MRRVVVTSTRRARAPMKPRRNMSAAASPLHDCGIAAARSVTLRRSNLIQPWSRYPMARPTPSQPGHHLQTPAVVRGAHVQCLRRKHAPPALQQHQHSFPRVRPVDSSPLASHHHNERRCGPKRTKCRCGSLSAPLEDNFPTFTAKGGPPTSPCAVRVTQAATMALFLANILQTARRLRQLTLATVAVTFHPSVSVVPRRVSPLLSLQRCVFTCSALSTLGAHVLSSRLKFVSALNINRLPVPRASLCDHDLLAIPTLPKPRPVGHQHSLC